MGSILKVSQNRNVPKNLFRDDPLGEGSQKNTEYPQTTYNPQPKKIQSTYKEDNISFCNVYYLVNGFCLVLADLSGFAPKINLNEIMSLKQPCVSHQWNHACQLYPNLPFGTLLIKARHQQFLARQRSRFVTIRPCNAWRFLQDSLYLVYFSIPYNFAPFPFLLYFERFTFYFQKTNLFRNTNTQASCCEMLCNNPDRFKHHFLPVFLGTFGSFGGEMKRKSLTKCKIKEKCEKKSLKIQIFASCIQKLYFLY